MSARLRCAVYTRKSSEEGLEQGFNSLHAQREAAEAYILSQAGEGWVAIDTVYDDGGYSGGTLARPALRHLLADIEAGLIDIVVVYKVDRLTRSLTDFAKIVEAFDARGVSFVSVTQAFSTTTSMGRLTLNVLLSFAQFEREVTGERIRDKITASKAKGLRMGGRPPLGYDVVDLRLVINAGEADQVRHIFQRYLELGSVVSLVSELNRTRVTAKRWINRHGIEVGGGKFSRSAVYYLLSNPVYRGVNKHKAVLHEGAHPAIVDDAMWAAVQAQLASANASQPSANRVAQRPLLAGLLYDDRGHPMTPVHTVRRSKRYRYYYSSPRLASQQPLGSLPRIAAGVVEGLVASRVEGDLRSDWLPGDDARQRMRAAIKRVVLGAQRLTLTVAEAAVENCSEYVQGAVVSTVELALPIIVKRRQGACTIVAPRGSTETIARVDKALIGAVALSRSWARALADGSFESIKQLAREQRLCEHYTMKLAPLAYLAPDIVTMIVEGRQPASLSLKSLTSRPLPLSWDAQRRRIAEITGGADPGGDARSASERKRSGLGRGALGGPAPARIAAR